MTWRMHGSAQLKVIIACGFSAPYQRLLREFERKSGTKVTTGSGASQGTGPQTIGAQLARGVAADVVILSREGLSELIAANRIAVGTDVDLAQVPLGVAVRCRGCKPRRQHRRSVQTNFDERESRCHAGEYERYLSYERPFSTIGDR